MFKTTASQCFTYLYIAPDTSWCPFFKPSSLITSFTFRRAAWSPWTIQWSNLPTSPWWGCLAWRLPSEGLDPRWHQGSLPHFPKEQVCQTGCSSPNLGCKACSVGEPGRRNRKTKEIHCFVMFIFRYIILILSHILLFHETWGLDLGAFHNLNPGPPRALMSGLLFLVHLLACICGSIINGQRLELSRMIALSMDKASFGR